MTWAESEGGNVWRWKKEMRKKLEQRRTQVGQIWCLTNMVFNSSSFRKIVSRIYEYINCALGVMYIWATLRFLFPYPWIEDLNLFEGSPYRPDQAIANFVPRAFAGTKWRHEARECPGYSELNVDKWNDNCEAKSEAKSPRPLRGLQVDSSRTRNVPYAVR